MTGITTIFWDNDGVLVDTEPLYYQATREILAELGLEFTAEQYRQFVLVQNIGAFHLAELQGMNEEAIAELRRRRNARYAELLSVTPTLIDGAAATLRALPRKSGASAARAAASEKPHCASSVSPAAKSAQTRLLTVAAARW